jgi:formamidopyrimidine-DNA glycosylase
MPELAEVEYYRKAWSPGLKHKIVAVHLDPQARIFRGSDAIALKKSLPGSRLQHSVAHGKQMLFRFDRDLWLGIHLGMTGQLRCEPPHHRPTKHEHLVLFQAQRALVFSDFRLFGRIRFERSPHEPEWWTKQAPALLSSAFTVAAMTEFLKRRKNAPLKAVLLMQDRFPGLGNWMVDEILWRAALHPARKAGSLEAREIRTLWKEIRWVSRKALKIIGHDFSDPPQSWLFLHRWKKGGKCPRTGDTLKRAEIGGRTTCWSPARQKLKPLSAVS